MGVMLTMLRSDLTTDRLAAALASTSISSIADLLAADMTCRRRAADHLARDLVDRLSEQAASDPRQLGLPL